MRRAIRLISIIGFIYAAGAVKLAFGATVAERPAPRADFHSRTEIVRQRIEAETGKTVTGRDVTRPIAQWFNWGNWRSWSNWGNWRNYRG